MPVKRGCVAVLLALVAASCAEGSARPHATIDSLDALRSAFNADSGKVRSVFLASPTCGKCVLGAQRVQQAWLANDASENVAVYVVWSPQLGAEEHHVASATAVVPDARAIHYWDGAMLAGKAFQPLLNLPDPAWDVWMLFGPDAVWGAEGPPAPEWWEHQLRAGPPELRLDPSRFASRAEALQRARR